MCSRFSFAIAKEEIEEQFNISIGQSLRQSYNIAPTHHAYVITNDGQGRLQYLTWGLIPQWSNDGKNHGKLINARCENIAGQTSFRIPIRKQRCLVLADSYYIWQRKGMQQLPYRVKLKQPSLMVFAGIWDVWYKGDYALKSFSIVTTRSNQDLEEWTDRMPLILPSLDQQKQWLADMDLAAIQRMFRPLANDQLDIYRVSEKLNELNNNSIDLHQLFS